MLNVAFPPLPSSQLRRCRHLEETQTPKTRLVLFVAFFPPLNSAVKKVRAREEQNQKMESYNSTTQRVDTWKSL